MIPVGTKVAIDYKQNGITFRASNGIWTGSTLLCDGVIPTSIFKIIDENLGDGVKRMLLIVDLNMDDGLEWSYSIKKKL